jgi:hypothetical protein
VTQGGSRQHGRTSRLRGNHQQWLRMGAWHTWVWGGIRHVTLLCVVLVQLPAPTRGIGTQEVRKACRVHRDQVGQRAVQILGRVRNVATVVATGFGNVQLQQHGVRARVDGVYSRTYKCGRGGGQSKKQERTGLWTDDESYVRVSLNVIKRVQEKQIPLPHLRKCH